MAGALQRFRVLEFGHYVAAPVLGMLLADQGAEVIKVEPPSGDPMRGSPAFAVWNRGKKSVSLDLQREHDLHIAEELAASADVLIENYSPGVLGKLGLSYERCQQLNERIIYLSMPNFPKGHPDEYAEMSEPVMNAATGVYVDRSEDGAGPSFLEVPYVSLFAAMVAAPAVTAALFHCERTGEGQFVSVPLYNSMLTAMGSNLVRRLDGEQGRPLIVHPVIGRFYKCRDERWVNINASYPRALQPMLKAMGHSDWFEPLSDRAHLEANPDERDIWNKRFTDIWLERTSQDWEALMEEAGVPCTVCRTTEEWLESVQAQETGAIVSLNDPNYGLMKQVGLQVKLSQTPGEIRDPAPSLGQHTEDVIARLKGF